MDDDEEKKPVIHTIETLFFAHANNGYWNVNNEDAEVEIDNEEYDTILLGQIDFWLNLAGLIGNTFTLTDTGLAYMEFKKWRLDYEDFMRFISIICNGKQITEDEVKQLLLDAGPPPIPESVVVK